MKYWNDNKKLKRVMDFKEPKVTSEGRSDPKI